MLSEIEREKERIKELRRENESQIKNIDDSIETLRNREEQSKENFDKYFKKCEPKFKALSWILYISALNVISVHYATNIIPIPTIHENNSNLYNILKTFYIILHFLLLIISFLCFMYHSSIFNRLSIYYLDFRLTTLFRNYIVILKKIPYNFMVKPYVFLLKAATKLKYAFVIIYIILISTAYSFEK
ncbi:hypothetical protein AD930_05080 [Acetobacter malorum]|nr:hypothetical protein AD930_05080 [Acetobacter malorum]